MSELLRKPFRDLNCDEEISLIHLYNFLEPIIKIRKENSGLEAFDLRLLMLYIERKLFDKDNLFVKKNFNEIRFTLISKLYDSIFIESNIDLHEAKKLAKDVVDFFRVREIQSEDFEITSEYVEDILFSLEIDFEQYRNLIRNSYPEAVMSDVLSEYHSKVYCSYFNINPLDTHTAISYIDNLLNHLAVAFELGKEELSEWVKRDFTSEFRYCFTSIKEAIEELEELIEINE